MEISLDLYNARNYMFEGFIKNQLLYSITVKNSERQFLRVRVKQKKKLQKKYMKRLQRSLMFSNGKKIYKKKKLPQTKFKIINRFYYNLIYYYYKIWNFKQYSDLQLKNYIKSNQLKKPITPQFSQIQFNRNYYSYQFFLFARIENYKYRINNKLYLKKFYSKLRKNLIRSCPIYSYFKYFQRYAFNQKFLLFNYFEVNWTGVNHIIKSRFLKKSISYLIKYNELKTLKLLKFYSRKVKSKRTFKKR